MSIIKNNHFRLLHFNTSANFDLSPVLRMPICNLIAMQMCRGNIPRTLHGVCVKPIAICDALADNLICVQFADLDIALALDVAVDFSAFDGLMTYHVAVDGAIRDHMTVNLHFKVLRAVIAIMGKRDFDGRHILRNNRRYLQYLFVSDLYDPYHTVILHHGTQV